MAHLHKKVKKGRPYYYIREIRRVNGRPKVVSQIYLGSVERIAKRITEAEQTRTPLRLQARSFGALFVVHELEKKLDTIGLIDRIVPRAPREKGPSVGEYFFYAWANRLIAPKSKRALSDWYHHTAVQEIRPVSIEDLTSQRYWEKWSRVQTEDIEAIVRSFFATVWRMQPLPPECVLFDTTNYYTFMSSHTESELCERGHNKAGKHHLRQVGLALLADRETHLPLYCRAYKGNDHDSKLFRQIIDELFGVMCGFNQSKQRLTVVFDKGMNSEEAIQAIDDHTRIHFITTYSTYFAEELAGTDLRKFVPLDIDKNRRLVAEGLHAEDRMRAFRTRMELWGQERTVVVTYNPRTARKQTYTLQRKMESLRTTLLEFRRNYRENRPHWRSPETIKERYLRACEKLHMGAHYYELEFGDRRKAPDMSFRKDHYQVAKAEALFGKNIIVTDNHDWTTEEIVQLSLDRYGIEKQFRATKSSQHVQVNPLYHWTDGKIRCHLLTCVIALTALRLLEITVNTTVAESKTRSGAQILEEMAHLNSVWLWYPGKRKPEKVLEAPTDLQSEVLKAFGWAVGDGGALQSIRA
jgi:transposase